MKKRFTFKKFIALLSILCLVSSCFVGGTLAKYVTSTELADTAGAAEFGVELKAYSDVFAASYNGTIDGGSAVTVEGASDLVAPGTAKENAAGFKIEGNNTEVAVRVTVDFDASGAIVVPAKTYTEGDFTQWVPGATYEDGKYNDLVVADAYYPVKWTLKKNGTAVLENKTLAEIETYLEDLNGEYAVGALETEGVVGEYTLGWNWPYAENDPADTLIGKVKAGDYTDAGVNTTEGFSLSITIEQID